MSDLESKFKEEREYKRRFFAAIPIYYENKNSSDSKLKKLSEYAANIVADGFIKYSGDKIGEITLGVIRDDVMEYPELIDKIKKKAKEKGVKVSLGENTRKFNLNRNNNKGIFQVRN